MPENKLRPTTLRPITLSQFKTVLKRYSYECVHDIEPILQFEKDGSIPEGYEEAVAYWPRIRTHRYPDFHSDKHEELVYDSSEVLDFLLSFISRSSPYADRTEISMEVTALLKPGPRLVAVAEKPASRRDIGGVDGLSVKNGDPT
jgi:hypothetical protein